MLGSILGGRAGLGTKIEVQLPLSPLGFWRTHQGLRDRTAAHHQHDDGGSLQVRDI